MEGKEKRSEVKRTQGDYNLGFKLEVVSEVETGEMTYKQAQRKYGIQGRSTVLVWLRKHGRLDWKRYNLAPDFRTDRKASILQKRRSPKWNQNK